MGSDSTVDMTKRGYENFLEYPDDDISSPDVICVFVWLLPLLVKVPTFEYWRVCCHDTLTGPVDVWIVEVKES